MTGVAPFGTNTGALMLTEPEVDKEDDESVEAELDSSGDFTRAAAGTKAGGSESCNYTRIKRQLSVSETRTANV